MKHLGRAALVLLGLLLIALAVRWTRPRHIEIGKEYVLGGKWARVPVAESSQLAADIANTEGSPQFWDWVDRQHRHQRVVFAHYGDRVVAEEETIVDDAPVVQVRVLVGDERGARGWIPQRDLVEP